MHKPQFINPWWQHCWTLGHAVCVHKRDAVEGLDRNTTSMACHYASPLPSSACRTTDFSYLPSPSSVSIMVFPPSLYPFSSHTASPGIPPVPQLSYLLGSSLRFFYLSEGLYLSRAKTFATYFYYYPHPSLPLRFLCLCWCVHEGGLTFLHACLVLCMHCLVGEQARAACPLLCFCPSTCYMYRRDLLLLLSSLFFARPAGTHCCLHFDRKNPAALLDVTCWTGSG